MRIVAGVARGRSLGRTPNGVRPTSDKVREALFSILGPIVDARVLDLFAGTGALGLEALSRGATCAVLVDESAHCARAIRENALSLGFEPRVRVLRLRADRALRTLGAEGTRFDLVFVDPPYGRAIGDAILADLVRSPVLSPDATVVFEAATRDAVPAAPGLRHASARRYGDTTLHFYERTPPTEAAHV